MNTPFSTERFIKQKAQELGLAPVGIAEARSFEEMSHFERWLRQGYAADMAYLGRRLLERLDPQKVLPGAKSVIVCGLSYNRKSERSVELEDANRGWISRYAWGDDYHEVLKERLRLLASHLERHLQADFAHKIFVDTGPVLERVFAYHAGLGWFGKNACIIHPKLGSYFFLGVILTDLELMPDEPLPDRCGTCQRCLEACPTGALVAPRVLDSRLCISYQTIENRGPIGASVAARLEKNLFGCDICQEVCPWNRRAPLSQESCFDPRPGFYAPDLQEFFKQVFEEYPAGFKNSALKRAKKRGLLRNVMVQMGNACLPEYLQLLRRVRFEDELLENTRKTVIRRLEKGNRADIFGRGIAKEDHSPDGPGS